MPRSSGSKGHCYITGTVHSQLRGTARERKQSERKSTNKMEQYLGLKNFTSLFRRVLSRVLSFDLEWRDWDGLVQGMEWKLRKKGRNTPAQHSTVEITAV